MIVRVLSSPRKGFDMRALFLAFGLVATPAMAADQFDLVCQTEAKHSINGRWAKEELRYRVDLGALRWCQGACNGTDEVVEVKDTQLTLINREPKLSSAPTELLWIDRQSGALSYIRTGGIGNYEQRRGRCERTAFSGFPAVTRKF